MGVGRAAASMGYWGSSIVCLFGGYQVGTWGIARPVREEIYIYIYYIELSFFTLISNTLGPLDKVDKY